jgi:hypothetical protein
MEGAERPEYGCPAVVLGGVCVRRNGRETRMMGVMADRFEYKVVELREKMIGGKMSGGKLERLLNDHAAEGWQLKAITAAEVKGRIGPGGVEGILVTFERRV